MNIGSVDLSSASVVAVSNYDYYKSDGGEIIGGVRTIRINGSIVVEDSPGSTSGQMVMSKLKGLVSLGQEPKCLMVDVPGYSGQAKIENVTTSQGSDPAWINKAEFSIELKAPLDTIPSNSFGFTASDSVVRASSISKIEFPEDHHGYVYSESFHKTYATEISEISVSCEPICQSNFDLIKVLNKINNNSSSSDISPFSSWNKYAKSRSVQVTGNSFVINTQYIISPHKASAFTDLTFSHSRTYTDNPSTKKTISGTITGLTDASIFSNNGFSGTCSASKLSNAEAVFGEIKGRFSRISSWEGIELELVELRNPFASTATVEACPSPDNDTNAKPCIKPSLSTIAKSRTDGTIDFTFEWSTDNNNNCSDIENRISTDITIDLIEPQLQFVEHVIPWSGTLIQNLNAKNAKRINIQIVTTYPQDICGPLPPPCPDDSITEILNKYQILCGLLIKDAMTKSKNSITRDRTYIECC